MKSIQINNIPKSQSLFNCKWHFYQNIPSENQFYTFIFPRALPPSIHHRLTAQETKVFGGIANRKNINKIFGASQTVHPTVSWRRHAESDAVDRISVYICSNFVLFSSLATENSTKKGRKIPPQNPSTPRKKLELVPFEKFTQKDIPFAVHNTHRHTDINSMHWFLMYVCPYVSVHAWTRDSRLSWDGKSISVAPPGLEMNNRKIIQTWEIRFSI